MNWRRKGVYRFVKAFSESQSVVESKSRVWDHEVSQEEVCPQEVHIQDPRIWVEHTESLAKEMKGRVGGMLFIV